MQRRNVLLAAALAGLVAPSFGLVRLDGPTGHVIAPSIASAKSLQRTGVPSLSKADALVLNKKASKVLSPRNTFSAADSSFLFKIGLFLSVTTA